MQVVRNPRGALAPPSECRRIQTIKSQEVPESKKRFIEGSVRRNSKTGDERSKKVKKLAVMVIAGAVAGFLLFPQVASAAPPTFGLKVGVNLSNLNGSDVATFESEFGPMKSKIGFCGGGYMVFALSKGMAIQVEALYTQKGSRFDMDVDGETVVLHWNEDYIEIPVLFKYTFETKGNIKPVLFAGPSVALKMSAKLKASFQGTSEDIDIPGFQSSDIGLVFGGGIDIGPRIRVDLRYTMGLTKLIEIEGQTGNLKNGVFSLMVGYSLK